MNIGGSVSPNICSGSDGGGTQGSDALACTPAVPTEAGGVGLSVCKFAEPSPCRTIVLACRKNFPLAEALKQLAATIREAYPSGEEPVFRR